METVVNSIDCQGRITQNDRDVVSHVFQIELANKTITPTELRKDTGKKLCHRYHILWTLFPPWSLNFERH